jgi:hypothetical protein
MFEMYIEQVNEVEHHDKNLWSIYKQYFLAKKKCLTEFNWIINLAALGILCVEWYCIVTLSVSIGWIANVLTTPKNVKFFKKWLIDLILPANNPAT